MQYTTMDSPVGTLLLAAEQGKLCLISFQDTDHPVTPDADWVEQPDALAPVVQQLHDYFEGKRREFDLELAPDGTAFQKSVWNALQRIPYGEVSSYGQVAVDLGRPSATRAVGSANGRNPLPIVIPCHRVVGADGSLTGFSAGVAVKRALLEHERRHHRDGGVQMALL